MRNLLLLLLILEKELWEEVARDFYFITQPVSDVRALKKESTVPILSLFITSRHAALRRDGCTRPLVRPLWRDIAILAGPPLPVPSTLARSQSAPVVHPRLPPAPGRRLYDRPCKPRPWPDSQSDYYI